MRLLTVTGAVLLLLAGCVQSEPVDVPTPAPSVTPVFASEEEALAAAEEAYAAYVELADQIFIEGGVQPERLAAVATGEFLDASVAGFEMVQEDGWTSTGGTVFRNLELQSFDPFSPIGVLTVYVCEDVSAVDVFDATGASVVSPGRPDTTTLQATFDLVEGSLLISGREAWSNEPC